MASAHPEGEVYFQRSSLQFPGWSAARADQFYTHCLIEWVSNEPMGRRQGSAPNHATNPRSTYLREKGPGLFYNVWFGFWSHLPVSLGERNRIRRIVRIPLETDVRRFKDRDNGAAQTVWVHPCPMPTEEEKWLWIDLIAPIRAVYFPLSQSADEDFPHLCTYVQVNFYQQGRRDVWRLPGNVFMAHHFSPQNGVGFANNHTMGINVQECIKLLALPPKLRTTNIWRERLIVIANYNLLGGSVVNISQLRHFDFIDFINANFAVDVIWKPVPPRNSFIRDLIGTVIAAGLGCVPGVGPLLSAGFSVAWQAVTDPDGFRDWAREGGWALTVIETVIGSADSMRGYVHPRWKGSYNVNRGRLLEGSTAAAGEGEEEQEERGEEGRVRDGDGDEGQVAPSELLLHGLRIMAFSARSSRSRHDGHLHTPILLRAVECGTLSVPEALAVERGLEALPEQDPEDPEGASGDRVQEVEESEDE
ncbi:hypothetical protein P170DRAFT_464790 [Aspergillus steynii IBT 23096]|uniref:Uncharacterized protein n=1 Tax=Aspergillus steynii IBT 23096 TaxID=1392250 RepID=A0A2I2G8Z0_9EURO|nr:uncharacterized protein P170DRAFT_464790 [Aspergillus steynii IBT 23096]PLB49350.1 hypothetical protein P170DRAFT_464790 [Aspergillus steynii IBT 23096]